MQLPIFVCACLSPEHHQVALTFSTSLDGLSYSPGAYVSVWFIEVPFPKAHACTQNVPSHNHSDVESRFPCMQLSCFPCVCIFPELQRVALIFCIRLEGRCCSPGAYVSVRFNVVCFPLGHACILSLIFLPSCSQPMYISETKKSQDGLVTHFSWTCTCCIPHVSTFALMCLAVPKLQYCYDGHCGVQCTQEIWHILLKVWGANIQSPFHNPAHTGQTSENGTMTHLDLLPGCPQRGFESELSFFDLSFYDVTSLFAAAGGYLICLAVVISCAKLIQDGHRTQQLIRIFACPFQFLYRQYVVCLVSPCLLAPFARAYSAQVIQPETHKKCEAPCRPRSGLACSGCTVTAYYNICYFKFRVCRSFSQCTRGRDQARPCCGHRHFYQNYTSLDMPIALISSVTALMATQVCQAYTSLVSLISYLFLHHWCFPPLWNGDWPAAFASSLAECVHLRNILPVFVAPLFSNCTTLCYMHPRDSQFG